MFNFGSSVDCEMVDNVERAGDRVCTGLKGLNTTLIVVPV